MKLVERKTNKLVEIPDAAVADAFRSGLYGIPKGAVMPVNAGGVVGTVDGAQFQQAIDTDATVPTEAQYREAQANNSSALTAGGAGFIRGAGSMFGVPTDQALIGLGDAIGAPITENDPYHGLREVSAAERMRRSLGDWQSGHSTASTAGEFAGMGATALLAGGGAVGKLGGVAEGLVPEVGGRVGNALLRGVVRGGAEGAALGGVNTINEAALGDTDLNAEKLFAGIGHGAIFGGALGGAFTGLGLAAGGAKDAAGRYLRSAGPEEIQRVANRALEGEAADGLGQKLHDGLVKTSAAVSGQDADLIAKFSARTPEGAEARRIGAFDGDAVHAEAARVLREEGDALLKANNLVTDEARGGLKRAQVEKSIKTGNEAEVHSHTSKLLDGILSGTQGELDGEMAPSMLKSVESVSKSAYQAQKALASGADNATLFTELDTLKRNVQKLTSNGYNALRNIADPVDQINARRTVAFFDKTAEELRQTLQDRALFGEAAAQQEAINSAWTKQIDASSRFHKTLTTEVGRDPSNPYLKQRGIDPSKADTYVKGLTNPNKDLTHQAVHDYLDSTEQLSKAIHEAYELPGEKAAQVKQIGESAAKMRTSLQKAEKSALLVNQYKQLMSKGDGGTIAGAVLGHLVGGPLGGAVGTVAGALANPGRAIGSMAAVERMLTKSDLRIASAARSFLRGGKSAAVETAETATPKVFEQNVAALREAQTNPQVAAQRVTDALGDLGDHAPKLAQATALQAARSLSFLASKIPPGMKDQNDFLLKDAPPLVSQTERNTFARYTHAATDPASVVEHLAKGDVTPEEVETLKAVYPKMYEQVRQQVADEVTSAREKGKELSYDKRVALGTLFDVPTDTSMQLDVRQAVNAATAVPGAPAQAGGKGGGSPRPHMMQDHSLQALTKMQSVSFGTGGRGK